MRGQNSNQTKIVKTPLNTPRREIFAGYLGSAGALTVAWQINFNWKNGSTTIVNLSCAPVLSDIHYGIYDTTGSLLLVLT